MTHQQSPPQERVLNFQTPARDELSSVRLVRILSLLSLMTKLYRDLH
jgi:hypothetical protein